VNGTLQTVLLALMLVAASPGHAEQTVPQGFPAAIFYAMALVESGQSKMTAGY